MYFILFYLLIYQQLLHNNLTTIQLKYKHSAQYGTIDTACYTALIVVHTYAHVMHYKQLFANNVADTLVPIPEKKI